MLMSFTSVLICRIWFWVRLKWFWLRADSTQFKEISTEWTIRSKPIQSVESQLHFKSIKVNSVCLTSEFFFNYSIQLKVSIEFFYVSISLQTKSSLANYSTEFTRLFFSYSKYTFEFNHHKKNSKVIRSLH